MKKYILPLLLFLLSSDSTYAQYENVWVFGGHIFPFGPAPARQSGGVGIDFNQGLPPTFFKAAIRSEMPASASNASVCSINGELLFYTDGDTVWNKNNDVMLNGADLIGLGGGTINTVGRSGGPGVLIVPSPGDDDQYYVFSLTNDVNNINRQLYYSIVDITLDNGLGGVVAGQKSVFVDSGFLAMAGVAGNDCNIWLVTTRNEILGQGEIGFKSFEINKNGINTNPVLSQTGTYSIYDFSYGRMSFASNREKMVLNRIHRGTLKTSIELFDFDPGTGIVSFQMNLIPNFDSTVSRSIFSPNGRLLYTLEWYWTGTNNFEKLVQYDLSSGNFGTIVNSKVTITDSLGYWRSDLKHGPGNKIYYLNGEVTNGAAKRGYSPIGVINYPDLIGMACQPNDTAIKIPYPEYDPGTNLPTDVPIAIKQQDTGYHVNNISFCLNQQDSLTLQSPLDGGDYIWQGGSTDSTFTIGAAGTFWVISEDCHHYRVDTFKVTTEFLQPVIQIDSFELSVTGSYDTYQWLLNGSAIFGATQSTYTVNENGFYRVVVSKNDCIDTADAYEVTNHTGVHMVNAIAAKIDVYPNPATSFIRIQSPVNVDAKVTSITGKVVRVVRNAETIDVQDLSEGIYFIRIYNQDGLLLKVTKFVRAK